MSQQHLHLDLALGARAELIVGALLAVGAPRAAALDALAAVGLGDVGLVEEHVRVRGLIATAARLTVPGEGERPPLEVRGHARAPRRARVAQARRTGVRRASSPAAAEQAAMPVPGALVLPPASRSARAPRALDAWRSGGVAAIHELAPALASSSLPAVSKALAHKAARRLASSLERVAGPQVRLSGAAAVRMLAEITALAALVDALSPAAITATPVGLSCVAAAADGVVDASDWPTPSPWLLETLAGVPLVEHDRPWIDVDVAGAAAAWAVVHRFGARGVAGVSRQGIGAAPAGASAGGAVVRALIGPPVPLATRGGEAGAASCVALSASLSEVDATPLLVERLRALGALDVHLTPQVTGLGAGARLALSLAAPAAATEPLCEALWQAGAAEVLRTWADRWTPARLEVTVTVGRGRTKASVRVQVTSSAGRLVRVEPVLDDVQAAARRSRQGEHAIAAAAVAAAEAAVGREPIAVHDRVAKQGAGQQGAEDEGGDDDDDGR
ncbi:MAG: DUF111 family protein [Deltaproteobacteria bacterium]|nr:DUF111 family protein [Deltaproteobacteria bacterium]